MAEARKHGREYAITNAVTEIIQIPAGFEPAGQTLVNDGTEDIFWREYDPTITYAGTIAELIAEALGGSRLQPTEYAYIASCNIVAVCSTDEQATTSTLRVAPGRLSQSGDTDIAALATVVHNEDDAYTAKDAGIPPLVVRKDARALPAAAADGDYLPLQANQTGELRVRDDDANTALTAISTGLGASMTSAAVNVDAGAAQELIAAPAAGHQLWIYGYELHANIGGTYQLLSAATAKTGIMPVAALSGVARDSSNPIFKCATAEALNITAVTCAADGIITYRDVTL